MVLKRIYGLGSRDAQKIIEIPECAECRKTLGMRPDWKEINGKKYCNACAKKLTEQDLI